MTETNEAMPCDCYKCVGARYETINGHKTLINNREDHTLGELCDECGHEKSEYRDYGTKGRYTCWWCNERAAGATPVNEL